MDSNIVNVTAYNFDEIVLQPEVPVAVLFSASWCGPCKMIKPEFEKVSNNMIGILRFCDHDVDVSSLTEKYGITAIPTIIIFKNGKPFDRMIGVHTKKDIVEFINKSIK